MTTTSSSTSRPPTRLYEVLAAEAARAAQAKAQMEDVVTKFGKPDSYFRGETVVVKMTADDAAAKAVEDSESSVRPVTTSVVETLDYSLKIWANAEDVKATKNLTNTTALADLILEDGKVLATGVPVDELMGLEARLLILIGQLKLAPTLDASKTWEDSTAWAVIGLKKAPTQTKARVVKNIDHIVTVPATDKFPAQVVQTTKETVIGRTDSTTFSTALSSEQKANLMSFLDSLVVSVRKARNRANAVPVIQSNLGTVVVAEILASLAV